MRVDFYLLSDVSSTARFSFTCRLIEKAYAENNSLLIYCETINEVMLLDKLLWTYNEQSFIPHALYSQYPNEIIPIEIASSNDLIAFPIVKQILINLSEKMLDFHVNFQRIIEIVPNDESIKPIIRSRYRFYQQANYDIYTHTIAN